MQQLSRTVAVVLINYLDEVTQETIGNFSQVIKATHAIRTHGCGEFGESRYIHKHARALKGKALNGAKIIPLFALRRT